MSVEYVVICSLFFEAHSFYSKKSELEPFFEWTIKANNEKKTILFNII